MLLQSILLLSLAVGTFARNDFRRSPSRPVHGIHRQVARRHIARQDPTSTGLPDSDGSQPDPPNSSVSGIRPSPTDPASPPGAEGSFKKDISYKGEDFFRQDIFPSSDGPSH